MREVNPVDFWKVSVKPPGRAYCSLELPEKPWCGHNIDASQGNAGLRAFQSMTDLPIYSYRLRRELRPENMLCAGAQHHHGDAVTPE